MNTAFITPNPHDTRAAASLCQRHEAEGTVTDVFPAWSAVAAAGVVAVVDGTVTLTAARTGLQLIVLGLVPDDIPPSARSAINAVLSRGAQRGIHCTILFDSATKIPDEWKPQLQVIDPAALQALGL